MSNSDKKCFYLFEQERLNSFSIHWKFSDESLCNKNSLAAAGFYKCSPKSKTNDACACFYCGKTLDGWDPEDDPFKEHKSHSPSCKFINLERSEADLKVREFLDLVESWCNNCMDKKMESESEQRIAVFNKFIAEVEAKFRK